ncbi:hypothetical protein EDB83DRAFT_141097 [Lactarius deliciosus]|nr:hypothetical protein EDB83DRAFT_141097 [Lactarius deliciosus]
MLNTSDSIPAHIIMNNGHTVVDKNDPYVRLVDEGLQSTSEAAVPGPFLVDLFLSLKHVPEWIPGAGFKKRAKEWRKLSQVMTNFPYDMVNDKVVSGCFVSACLELNAASIATGKGENSQRGIDQGFRGSCLRCWCRY